MSIMGNPMKKSGKHPPRIPVQIISLVVLRQNNDSPQTVARKAIHRRYRVYPDGFLVNADTGYNTGLLYGAGPLATLCRRPQDGYLSYSSPPQRRRPKKPVRKFNKNPIEYLKADYLDATPKQQEKEKNQPQVEETEKVSESEEKRQSQGKDEKVTKSEEKDQSEEEKVLTPEEDENESASRQKSRVFKMFEQIKKCRCESICQKMRKTTKKLNKCSIM